MDITDPMRSRAPQSGTEPGAAHDPSSGFAALWRRVSLRKSLVLTVALASLGLALQAPAANRQQERMKACNAEAKSRTLSGAERQDFMKRCLSGQDTASDRELNSQQRKMKTCNAEAKSKALKGSDRSRFMSSCLKSSP